MKKNRKEQNGGKRVGERRKKECKSGAKGIENERAAER